MLDDREECKSPLVQRIPRTKHFISFCFSLSPLVCEMQGGHKGCPTVPAFTITFFFYVMSSFQLAVYQNSSLPRKQGQWHPNFVQLRGFQESFFKLHKVEQTAIWIEMELLETLPKIVCRLKLSEIPKTPSECSIWAYQECFSEQHSTFLYMLLCAPKLNARLPNAY